MVDLSNVKADLSNIKTEEKKLEYFNNLVKQMDKDEENNNRKHNKHRADFDISILEVGTNRENQYIPSEITNLYHNESFENIIFSKKCEDLNQLIAYAPVSLAINTLSNKRKEILFLKGVWGYTEKEIAKYKSVSQANISQLFKKAIEQVKKEIDKS
jgi:DNA-directed RNA polymerase specialized sigma subunit